MIRILPEHKKACELLVSRREWASVEEILTAYLESLKDITTMDEEEKNMDKNVVFAARLKAYERLKGFLQTIGLLAQKVGHPANTYE